MPAPANYVLRLPQPWPPPPPPPAASPPAPARPPPLCARNYGLATIASSFFTLLPQQGCSQKTPPRFLCGFFCVGGWSLFATDHSERSREVHRERLSRYLQSTVIIPTHSKRDRKSFTRMLALLQPLSYSYIKAFFLGVFLGVVSTCQINELVKQR